MKGPALSVVVCTLGRPERIGPLLTAITEQMSDGDELLVVDQTVGPGAHDVRQACEGRARALSLQPPGLPAARNLAVTASDRPVVLFFDDDVRLHPGCLDGHRSAYTSENVGGVVGRIVEQRLTPNVAGLCNRVGRDGRIRTCLDGLQSGTVETLKGANMSIRREALLEAGPFETGLGGTALLEDAEISERLRRCGWVIRYAPSAAVDHDHDPVGGVRQATGLATLRSRFHNTGFFVGRHRPRRDLPLVLATHVAIAARHQRAHHVPSLVKVLIAGWRRGRSQPVPRWTAGSGHSG